MSEPAAYDPYDHPVRLGVLENGRGLNLIQRIKLWPIKRLAGGIPGPIVVQSYKRELFGRHFGVLMEQVMRGMSYWQKEDVELFASFTAAKLHCGY